MKTKELIDDIKARSKLVESWPNRLAKLKETRSINRAEFCRIHEIDLSWISRAIDFNPLPKWRTIKNVEAALEKEGV
jgi:hypothetical protein